MNQHIDLERMADDAELAFMQASISVASAEDEEKMKALLYQYLSVLKIIRLMGE